MFRSKDGFAGFDSAVRQVGNAACAPSTDRDLSRLVIRNAASKVSGSPLRKGSPGEAVTCKTRYGHVLSEVVATRHSPMALATVAEEEP